MQLPILVTGGLGFIGSAFIRRMTAAGARVVNLDAMTYASSPDRLAEVDPKLIETIRCDLVTDDVTELVARTNPAVVVHFAAESHVTRSETQEEVFMRTNVEGTRRVLEAAVEADVERFVHISTDEVYGPCLEGAFAEHEKAPGPGHATSPYARSKALADDLARSFGDRLPVSVIRPTNCFGEWQHPEKAIARWITRALGGERLPVWGDGRQTREWMHVRDACAGIELVATAGEPGETYNLGPGPTDVPNVEIARTVAARAGAPVDHVYLTAYDRPMHDRRYAVDSSKVRALGWEPSFDLEQGLADTVEWYRAHEDWWRPLVAAAETIYSDEEVSTS